MSECFKLEQVSLVFGKNPKRAFQAMDQGYSREQILSEFQQVAAVQNVSLEIKKGEIFVLMGLSGSGKSSLLRCFNGMNGRKVGALRGQIFYTDSFTGKKISIPTCNENEIRKLRKFQISMVFQQFGLMPWNTVWKNVEYPLKLQGKSKKIRDRLIEERLALVGLLEWKDRYPHELSGGMQQRVGLARAFVTQAEVLLMDEPFSALDSVNRTLLQNELLSLQNKHKKTIIFVTHDLSEAIRIASRIAIFESGKIQNISSPDQFNSVSLSSTLSAPV